MNIGAHTTHCCIYHGCKYGDKDCPVSAGDIKQDHSCEQCGPEVEKEFRRDTPQEWSQKMSDSELIKRLDSYITEPLPQTVWKEFLERYKALTKK